MNPGSASPKNQFLQIDFLESKNLPFYVSKYGTHYYVLSIDPLMSNLLKMYSSKYSGGILKLYNLFNLKNPKSCDALEQYKQNKTLSNMHTDINEIKYCGAPVIIVPDQSRSIYEDPRLAEELKKFISQANESQLFSLTKVKDKIYTIVKYSPTKDGIIESYHPSYTFNKYGNATQFT